ncbi:tonB-system energizer ExbB [Bosea sp. SSUT16]|jgi:biopolymer transport protein ExbB|uniref:Biopolymer transport protein ExbB n=1 Tax=Bosea spartocytisi TaxID=2773451 RepID=A0A927I2M5_9HYPH|nr:tonB-system energizer ExbB [Bosea spartocytisi]MBD3847768.1 tonB-system energizer ExbB [Bosea spartocytisi]MCT4471396.1 tonB-system energizer ExbB [Bosea spartocytisi]
MTRLLRSAFLALSLLLPASAALAQIQGAPQVPAQPASPPAMQPAPPPAAPANPLPPAASQMGIAPPSAAHPPLQPGDTPASLPVAPAPQAAATLPHDLSPWGMFMAADIVVKAVMIGLAFASLVTWTIWLAKVMELAAAKTGALRSLRRIEAADSLGDAAETISGKDGKLRGAVGALLSAALEETRRSVDLGEDGIKERAAIALSRIEARAGRNMARGTGLLATIGSTAPFVGLFGTVWGIMNSFIGISQAKTTNLAVVAPGIAEALLATAIGLVAAIPAVIIYNVFARAITGYRATLSDASGEILRHLSRDLERRQRLVASVPARSVLQAVPPAAAAMPRVRAE